MLSSITSALGLALLGMVPATETGLPWLRVLVVVGNIATATLSMSVESLMACQHCSRRTGATAGWFQVGNLGGGGLRRPALRLPKTPPCPAARRCRLSGLLC